MRYLAEDLVRDDFQAARARIPHDSLLLGFDEAGSAVCIPAHGDNVLIAGPRGSGKSDYAFGLLERLIQKKYLRQVLRDDELAREVSTIELRYELPAADSRRQVLGAITHRYALPA